MAFPPNAAKLAAYRSTVRALRASTAADPHRLIVMLMDGALERIATARGLMKHGGGAEKAQLLHRAVAIIDELRNSLNFKAGGAIAANLDALYEYMCMRLMQANASEQARVARRSQPPAERDPLGLAADCRAGTRAGAPRHERCRASQPRGTSASAAGARHARSRWRLPNRTPTGAASPPRCSPAPTNVTALPARAALGQGARSNAASGASCSAGCARLPLDAEWPRCLRALDAGGARVGSAPLPR